MQVIVDSLLTEYDLIGQGRVVLLLHGWADDRRSFAALSQQLSNSFQVVSLDLPGFGNSQLPKQVWDLDAYAKFVAAFLQKINAGAVYAIVGHSNGAAVAIRGLAGGQLSAQKLVLLAAAGIRTTQTARKRALKVIAKTGKVLTIWLPGTYRQKLRRHLYARAGSDMLLKPELQEMFKRTVSQDVQADARQLTLPVLLLYGQQDTATPPLYGELYRNQIPHASLQIVGQAGHFVHHDQPAQVEQIIREFLQ